MPTPAILIRGVFTDESRLLRVFDPRKYYLKEA